MALLFTNSKVLYLKKYTHTFKTIKRKYSYEIPERYRNCFYLANATFFDSTNWFIHRAYEKCYETLKNEFGDQNISEIIEILDQCNSVIDVRFPVKRTNGKYEIVRGFMAKYGQNIGYNIGLGGLRIDENVTRDHIKALSVLSAYKNNCIGLNLCGTYGGIKICYKNYSKDELKNIITSYIKELINRGYFVNNRDVVHPDLNTNVQIMSWISEAYKNYVGNNLNVTSIGKDIKLGGIENFEKFAALGSFKSLNFVMNNDYLMDKIGLTKDIKGKTFIMQGFGKVGKNLSKLLVENGATLIGIKTNDAYLYDSKGIDLSKLISHFEKEGTIQTFGLAITDKSDKIFTEKCDILVLSGPQKSLICYTARDVKAKLILEASDGPVTPTSQRIFESVDKLVVPDIYAGTGTNVAGYFEFIRNLQQIGSFREDILTNSHNIYVNVVKNFETAKKMVVGSHEIDEKVTNLSHDFVCNAMDCVYVETGHDILKNLYDYKLCLDLRSAAHIVAIKNIFKSFSNSNLFKIKHM